MFSTILGLATGPIGKAGGALIIAAMVFFAGFYFESQRWDAANAAAQVQAARIEAAAQARVSAAQSRAARQINSLKERLANAHKAIRVAPHGSGCLNDQQLHILNRLIHNPAAAK